jgi:hypothetical protein
MKRLRSGLIQAISSVFIGLALTAAVGLCTRQGWIPAYSPLLLSLFNIIANIFTLNKMRRWGIFYTIGWLAGSLVFNALGLLETTDLIFNVVVPIILFLVRLLLWLKNSFRRSKAFHRKKA